MADLYDELGSGPELATTCSEPCRCYRLKFN